MRRKALWPTHSESEHSGRVHKAHLRKRALNLIEGSTRLRRALRPRRAEGDELERYWAAALEVWPGYEGYRRRAGREIRMFVLEPDGLAGGQAAP